MLSCRHIYIYHTPGTQPSPLKVSLKESKTASQNVPSLCKEGRSEDISEPLNEWGCLIQLQKPHSDHRTRGQACRRLYPECAHGAYDRIAPTAANSNVVYIYKPGEIRNPSAYSRMGSYRKNKGHKGRKYFSGELLLQGKVMENLENPNTERD